MDIMPQIKNYRINRYDKVIKWESNIFIFSKISLLHRHLEVSVIKENYNSRDGVIYDDENDGWMDGWMDGWCNICSII